MKWCCEMFKNLETFILKGLCPYYHQVKFLLKRSRNLKNLQFTLKIRRPVAKVGLQFSNLEMLIVDKSMNRSSSKIVRGDFINSSQLRGFKGELTSQLIMDIEAKNSMAFSNLIALELAFVPSGVLKTLSKIDHLKLRYLKLGDTSDIKRHYISPAQFDRREIDTFYNLLSRLGQLKVLVAIFPMGLDCNSIQVLTMLRLDLTQACIRLDRLNSRHPRYNETGNRGQADPQVTIASFANMLVEKDSSMDLSTFEFIVNNEVSRSLLQAANTGLSIYSKHDDRSLYYDSLSLSHPVMRRQLGIDF
eukprot:g7716.t1